MLQRPVGQKRQRHHGAGRWDPRVQISDPPAPGAAQMLRKTVCAGLEKLGQRTSQRAGEGGVGRVRDPLGPSHLGCGSEPETQSPATPHPLKADGGGGRRVWPQPFGTPGSWASALPWPSVPDPSLPCPGRAGGPKSEGWAPLALVVPRPRSLWGLGSSPVEGLTLFVSCCVWELGLAGVLGGGEHAGWGDSRGRCAWGSPVLPGGVSSAQAKQV